MSNQLHGAKIIFRINGNKVAFATSVSYNEAINHEAVEVLDQLDIVEHVPVSYTCDFSAEAYRVSDKSIKQLGIMPVFDEIMTSGVLTAEFIDSETGRTMALFLNVRCTSRSGGFSKGSLGRENMSFVATRMLDESEA